MENEFIKYVSNYDLNINMIKLKYEHSFRVMELNENLAKQLELDEEDVKLARLIGLLHDFGRFEQYSVYATYDDDLSFDHADYAVEVLFNGNEIRKYIADNRYDNIIKMAIKNHNKFAIEGNLNEKELLHTKMIRDTDKLDILYNVSELGQIKIKETDDEITSEVIEQFFQNSTINKKTVKNSNDKIIITIALVFDFNFLSSIKHVIDNQLLDKIFEKINNKEKFRDYFEYAKNYINEIYERWDNNVKFKI